MAATKSFLTDGTKVFATPVEDTRKFLLKPQEDIQVILERVENTNGMPIPVEDTEVIPKDKPEPKTKNGSNPPNSDCDSTHWRRRTSTHKERWLNKLKNGTGSDVTLLVGKDKKAFKAHSLVLKTVSPVFQALLAHESRSLKELTVPDVEPRPFMLLLQFMYTGEVEAEVCHALGLLHAAKKFQLPDLLILCGLLLSLHLSDENVASVYQVATKNRLDDIADSTLHYIRRNAHNVLKTKDFLTLTSKNLCRLLKDDHLAVGNEMEIFKAVFRWAEAKCERKGREVNSKNLRATLKDFIPHIRWTQMNFNEFTQNVATKGILTDVEMNSILVFFKLTEEEQEGIRGLFQLGFNLRARK